MIKTNISREYPLHIAACSYSDKSLYLADYTNQTDSARGVEIFENAAPADIDYFTLLNYINLEIGVIKFDNTSFIKPNGNTLSQCECVVFPKTSNKNAWIFFAELKYSNRAYYNDNNLRKAISQLYKTRTYYYLHGIFSKTNTCYLLASLPMQAEPFAQTIISPTDLLRLKQKHNVILRLKNCAEIQNDTMIAV